MGGISAEREISLITGNKISESLKKSGYNVKSIDAVGNFWLELQQFDPDAVFIALHGRFGEDGVVQGLLDLMGIEYVGAGVLASALAMDKIISKYIFEGFSIPTPKHICLDKTNKHLAITEIIRKIKLPAVIKPASEGSAIGITVVDSEKEMIEGIESAFNYDDRILIEEFIEGPEITVGILGNDPPIALEIVQIVSLNHFYDYDAKYTPGKSKHIIPADIPGRAKEKCIAYALNAHNVINCRDFSRVDIKISPDYENIYVLEINTIPGMTETSLFPEAAMASGYDFDTLVDFLIKLPLARKKSRQCREFDKN